MSSPSAKRVNDITRVNSVLSIHEPSPFERLDFSKQSTDNKLPIVFCCDHASNRIPESLQNLGLSEELLQEHIAWDIGAAELTRRVAKNLSGVALLNNYSRLVVDCNRYLSDASAFSAITDTLRVPGNIELSELQKAQRAEAIYYRYHGAIRDELEKRVLAKQADSNNALAPVLISIHTFTPQLRGQAKRDIDVGVLWDKDGRIPLPLLKALRTEANLNVGDNQPYSGKDLADYTIDHHAETKGLAHTSLEIRQDLVNTEAGLQEWTERLTRVFIEIFQDKNIFTQLV